MYTKEELQQMDAAQLLSIAADYGITVSQDDDQEKVIYEILDQAAIDSASTNGASKRKRTRIAKKETDKVYTVNGKEGENYDMKSQKAKLPEVPSLFGDMPVADEQADTPNANTDPLAAFPKHRGRKSKAELAAIAAAEAAKRQDALQEEEKEEESVPEADVADESGEDMANSEMLEQLQEKMAQHAAASAAMEEEASESESDPDAVWEGDPGDGTDFIPVVDLPNEDHADRKSVV